MKKIIIVLIICCVSFGFTNAFCYDEEKSMVKISGVYGAALGFTPSDVIWKEANGDYQERFDNWRYTSLDYGVNAYDPRIFDRYQLDIETDTGTPWNAYAQIKMDPWSFTGIGSEMVYDENSNDFCTVNYKYWENTGKTINDSYRTYDGNFINTNEYKVIQDKVTHDHVVSGFNWDPFTTELSLNRSVKIDYFFRPVRKAWVEYSEEPLYMKVFPISDQSEALTTDDPLGLSNNHVYYAPSPWLFAFDPGMQLSNGVDPAKWNWDLAWYAEDSNRNYLTYLRGITVGYNYLDLASFEATIASPMSPWDYYEDANSVPAAARLKFHPTGKLTLGSTYTSLVGIYKHNIRGLNQVFGLDFNYNIVDRTDFFGECAGSYLRLEHANEQKQKNWDQAFKIGIKSEGDLGKSNHFEWDLSGTMMGKNFHPGLSDYKDTREDRDWGRHIWFDPLSMENEGARVGDSIDMNRYVIGFNLHADMLDNLYELYINFRNAHRTTTSDFIENIIRVEGICNPLPYLQFKGLFLNRKYPHSVGGVDPLERDRYTDEFILNARIDDGYDVDLYTFSGGFKLDLFEEKVSFYGIYEATNDPQEFPRDQYEDKTSEITGVDDITFNRLRSFLYGQEYFSLPPYQFFSVWKGVLVVRPVRDFEIRYTHVTNTNKNYAPLFDDNHNHDSIDVRAKLAKNMTFETGYSLSRLFNVRRAIDTSGADSEFEPHNNFYMRLNVDLDESQRVTFMYGESWLYESEAGMFGPKYLVNRVSTVDTRHIFRIFYQGKF